MLSQLFQTFNLGSGVGVSVLQLLETFGKVTGMSVPYEIKPRRDGDICSMYSNGERARLELGWIPSYTLEQMCEYSMSKEILFFFLPPSLFGERLDVVPYSCVTFSLFTFFLLN